MEKIQNTNWSALDPFEHCQTYFSNFLRLFKSIYDASSAIIRVKIKYKNAFHGYLMDSSLPSS